MGLRYRIECCVSGLFFFQAEDGIRYLVRSRELGDVYKRQALAGAQMPVDPARVPRLGADDGVAEHARVHVAELGHHDRALGAIGHYISAVSYTHLRAHETVLDLVCRLLLAKKKTHKQKKKQTRIIGQCRRASDPLVLSHEPPVSNSLASR